MIDPERDMQAGMSVDQPLPLTGSSLTSDKLLTDTEVPIVQLGQWSLVWRRFRRHHIALVGAVTLGLLALMAIFAPLISPESFFGNWNFVAGPVHPRWTFPWSSDWKYIM